MSVFRIKVFNTNETRLMNDFIISIYIKKVLCFAGVCAEVDLHNLDGFTRMEFAISHCLLLFLDAECGFHMLFGEILGGGKNINFGI